MKTKDEMSFRAAKGDERRLGLDFKTGLIDASNAALDSGISPQVALASIAWLYGYVASAQGTMSDDEVGWTFAANYPIGLDDGRETMKKKQN